MSIRTLLLGLAVAVCALWPQGLVLCVGEPGHVELEPGGTPCCPVDHPEGEGEDHEDCADCRDFESPEFTSAGPTPPVPAPGVTATADLPPEAMPSSTSAAGQLPPLIAADGFRTVILIV